MESMTKELTTTDIFNKIETMGVLSGRLLEKLPITKYKIERDTFVLVFRHKKIAEPDKHSFESE